MAVRAGGGSGCPRIFLQRWVPGALSALAPWCLALSWPGIKTPGSVPWLEEGGEEKRREAGDDVLVFLSCKRAACFVQLGFPFADGAP